MSVAHRALARRGELSQSVSFLFGVYLSFWYNFVSPRPSAIAINLNYRIKIREDLLPTQRQADISVNVKHFHPTASARTANPSRARRPSPQWAQGRAQGRMARGARGPRGAPLSPAWAGSWPRNTPIRMLMGTTTATTTNRTSTTTTSQICSRSGTAKRYIRLKVRRLLFCPFWCWFRIALTSWVMFEK